MYNVQSCDGCICQFFTLISKSQFFRAWVRVSVRAAFRALCWALRCALPPVDPVSCKKSLDIATGVLRVIILIEPVPIGVVLSEERKKEGR